MFTVAIDTVSLCYRCPGGEIFSTFIIFRPCIVFHMNKVYILLSTITPNAHDDII